MTQHFSIGRFSRLTGLTPRALRLYDKERLLEPAIINEETGYRYYAQSQALTAERIRLLRSIDMPLEDIRTVLAHPDTNICQSLLRAHRERIEAQLRCYQEALQTLSELSSRDITAYPIAVKELPAQPIIYTRRQTSLLQIETIRAQAFGELYGFLRQQNMPPAGPGFSANVDRAACSHSELLNLEADCVFIDVCVPVSHVIDNRCIASRVWDAGKVAYVVHTGPYEPIFQIYERIRHWLSEQQLNPTGLSREVYHLGLADVRDRNKLKTEIQFYIGD
jgi:DNA-binding transcriptional MerR regulator